MYSHEISPVRENPNNYNETSANTFTIDNNMNGIPDKNQKWLNDSQINYPAHRRTSKVQPEHFTPTYSRTKKYSYQNKYIDESNRVGAKKLNQTFGGQKTYEQLPNTMINLDNHKDHYYGNNKGKYYCYTFGFRNLIVFSSVAQGQFQFFCSKQYN